MSGTSGGLSSLRVVVCHFKIELHRFPGDIQVASRVAMLLIIHDTFKTNGVPSDDLSVNHHWVGRKTSHAVRYSTWANAPSHKLYAKYTYLEAYYNLRMINFV